MKMELSDFEQGFLVKCFLLNEKHNIKNIVRLVNVRGSIEGTSGYSLQVNYQNGEWFIAEIRDNEYKVFEKMKLNKKYTLEDLGINLDDYELENC